MFHRMENLITFIEILGYIAIALMLLQVFLTIGMLACKVKNESNESSHESLTRESYV